MNRIAIERKQLNLTQDELAEKLNLSQKSISKYETGARKPSFSTLALMAKFFGVSTDYLLELSDDTGRGETISKSVTPINILHDRLLTLLKDSSITDIALYAQASNIPLDTFQCYINGSLEPTAYDLCKIVETFDTSADYLFGFSNIPHPKEHTQICLDSKEYEWLTIIKQLPIEKQYEFKGELKGYLKRMEETSVTAENTLSKSGKSSA